MKKLLLAVALLLFLPVGEIQASSLQVQVSSNGGTLPRNGVRIPLLQVTLQTGNTPVTVESFQISRRGLSSNEDIDRVWLSQDFVRLSRARSFTNDDTLELTFTNPLTIDANSREVISVLANLSFSGGGRTLQLQLDDVVSNAASTIPLRSPLSYQQRQSSPGVFTHSRARYDRSQYRIKCENRQCRLMKR